MKKTILVATILLTLLSLASCGGDNKHTDNHGYSVAYFSFEPEIIETMDIPTELDLSGLEYGQGYRIRITKDSPLLLKDFSLDDGVTISPGLNKVTEATTAKSLGNEKGWLAEIVDNNLLASSNSDGNLQLIVQSMTTEETDSAKELLIAKFPGSEEMAILPSDYSSAENHLVEKYYRVNMSASSYDSLDKSNVAIIMEDERGLQARSVFFADSGKAPESDAIFDLSQVSTFGIYHNLVWECTSPLKIRLTSPIAITSEVELQNEVCVVKIPQSDEEQQLVLTYQDGFSADFVYDRFLRMLHARYRDGFHLGFVAIPYLQQSKKQIVLHIDPIEEDLYLTLNLQGTSHPVKAKVEPYAGNLNTNELKFSELDNLTIYYKDCVDDVYVAPLLFDNQRVQITAERNNLFSHGYGAEYGKNYSYGGFWQDVNLCEPGSGSRGLLFLYKSGNSEVSEDAIVLKLSEYNGQTDIACQEVIWDPVKQNMVCHNCETHGDSPVSYYMFITNNKYTVLKGTYSTSESYEGYGKIQIRNTVPTSELVPMTHTTGMQINNGKNFGFYGYNNMDTSKWIMIKFMKIEKTEDGKKKITVLLDLGGVGNDIETVLYRID